MSRAARLKSALHPWLDPLFSWPDHGLARRALAKLPDGEYRAEVEVPYYSQFASPDRINDYIHHGYDGASDPNWRTFGAESPDDYAFWSHRVCALACIKMAAEAFHPQVRPTLWELVQKGLAVKGYTVRDEHGNWLDEGWYYHAQAHLAKQYGLQAAGRSYISPLRICQDILDRALVGASVTPEIGEREISGKRYGGHMVLVYGFRWKDRRPTHYLLHNPSGRFTELQAGAAIDAVRFNRCFAHRAIMLKGNKGTIHDTIPSRR